MYVVAVAAVAGSLQAEEGPLAAILGCSEYDVRARMAGLLPAIVFRSSTEAEARRALAAVRARGHGALMANTREVIASPSMVDMHRFELDEVFLFSDSSRQRWLSFADIGALVAVATRTSVQRTHKEQQRVSSRGYRSATIERETTVNERVLERSLYVYPRDPEEEGAPPGVPWVLHERTGQFLGLGPALHRTRLENFQATVDLLRERAIDAIYDDRYLTAPRVASQQVQVRERETALGVPGDAQIDLGLHLLSRWLLRPAGDPYREAGR